MRRIARAAIGLAAFALLSPLTAQVACAQSLLTTSTADQVAAALTAMGKTVKVDTSGDDPDITIVRSDGSTHYDLYLMDCTAKRDCTSMELILTYSDNGSHSAQLANLWNQSHRMPGMCFNEGDKTMTLYFNASTAGGLTSENFTDLIKWWESGLGAADTFFSEHPAEKSAAAPAA